MEVPQAAIYGFLGPNGSGKTTTIRMMCGLLVPDDGEGQCLGFDIRTEPQRIKERVGYMTQRFSLYEDLTVRENLAFIARMFRMDRRRDRVREALRDLGLTNRGDQLAGTLSGGWKQRLALAACTLHEPRLLLLDEPTAGVDPKARRDFWDELAFFLGFNLFVAVNLAIGFLISTVAGSQMQAMQISFFTILPTILLSGFMFPFAGMPGWAQALGTLIPATHCLRQTRKVMLKGAALPDIAGDMTAILLIMALVVALALRRYRQTLE